MVRMAMNRTTRMCTEKLITLYNHSILLIHCIAVRVIFPTIRRTKFPLLGLYGGNRVFSTTICLVSFISRFTSRFHCSSCTLVGSAPGFKKLAPNDISKRRLLFPTPKPNSSRKKIQYKEDPKVSTDGYFNDPDPQNCKSRSPMRRVKYSTHVFHKVVF